MGKTYSGRAGYVRRLGQFCPSRADGEEMNGGMAANQLRRKRLADRGPLHLVH